MRYFWVANVFVLLENESLSEENDKIIVKNYLKFKIVNILIGKFH